MTDTSNTSTAAALLRSFIERVERIDEEIKGLNDDKRDIYAEVRSQGFDIKGVKEVIRLRRQDPAERQELETIVATYCAAIGMTPSSGSGDGLVKPFTVDSGALEEALNST